MVTSQRPRFGSRDHVRVLVIDDETDVRESIVDALQTSGYRAIAAADGREGLRRLRACEPDLVVLDLSMPVMDGWQFRFAQKQDPAIATTPVIAISALESAAVAKIDADDYLRKPFAADAILAAVDKLAISPRPEQDAAAMLHTERLTALGTLAAGMAHEINNLLTYLSLNLTGTMQTLASMDRSSDRARDSLDSAELMLRDALDGSQRIRDIVDNVLQFSRAESPPSAHVDVRRCLEAALHVVMSELRVRARLVIEQGELPPVLADEGSLGQVFVNLLTNAAQAIEAGFPDRNEVRIVTRTDEHGRAVIEIGDSGAGIPADVLDRIFEPFFTTKPVGKGSGLGLAISRGIIQKLGGEISATSELGRGTTFRVWLPPISS
jgi:signal transduction histidine kinase